MFYKELESFTNPTVRVEYITLGDYTDFRGDLNGFEINEEFSDFNQYRDHVNKTKQYLLQSFQKLESLEKLINIKERLISIKNLYRVSETSYYSKRKKQKFSKITYSHDNVSYKQHGEEKYFKTKNNDWVIFKPEYLSPFFSLQYNCIISLITEIDFQLNTTNKNKESSKIKITLIPEYQSIITKLLKNYFPPEDYPFLKRALQGQNINSKMVFQGQGNQLIDAFRRMLENDIVIKTSKKSLNEFIVENFSYKKGSEIKDFKTSNVTNVLSRNDVLYKCQNPLPDFVDKFPYKENH